MYSSCCAWLYRSYGSQGHTAQQVKQEVEMHLKEREILEAALPSNIIIGPFYVNTENVRQNLSKKRKALANAVLELLAKQLRKQADDVSKGFVIGLFFINTEPAKQASKKSMVDPKLALCLINQSIHT